MRLARVGLQTGGMRLNRTPRAASFARFGVVNVPGLLGEMS